MHGETWAQKAWKRMEHRSYTTLGLGSRSARGDAHLPVVSARGLWGTLGVSGDVGQNSRNDIPRTQVSGVSADSRMFGYCEGTEILGDCGVWRMSYRRVAAAKRARRDEHMEQPQRNRHVKLEKRRGRNQLLSPSYRAFGTKHNGQYECTRPPLSAWLPDTRGKIRKAGRKKIPARLPF